jgi:hypothetical protein
MKILTSIVVAAALSGCAYQSGYIAPDGAWVAKDVPYAKGTCRSNAPYVMGAPGPVGLRGWPVRRVRPGRRDRSESRGRQAPWDPRGPWEPAAGPRWRT